MTLEIRIMYAALRQNIGYRVANLLADSQLSLRAAGRGTLFLMMARHGRKSPRRARVWDTSIVVCPVETNEALMAGKTPAIALPQFQFKKIRALR
ncbi:hypothetical protein [Bradyrhizobium sp. CCBAU 53338]|uniref:hypothetical protein n=1 Tax=Bradyrhizobium sp. CCBAU 53338 TaxID=1325111 RepID=UPI001FED6A24|nr:hypothetical protein [Bradyrhizobium sp. CCBAU 53338]